MHHHLFGLAKLFFSEDALTPGSVITPYILPAASSAPFLRRAVADSIPMSTGNFTDIVAMFAPASLPMARDIWTSLHSCEHHLPLKGEQQGCPTSIESMVELAAAVLGTRRLRAFSSAPDVPVEGLASAPRGYVVASARRLTNDAAAECGDRSMTCHGMAFPFAVFFCHALNPSRVYDVTLRRRAAEDTGAATASSSGAAPPLVRALAVCHLDTSEFDPANPFFVERGLKPGDAPVCHFLARDSVLWAAAKQHVHNGHVAAQ